MVTMIKSRLIFIWLLQNVNYPFENTVSDIASNKQTKTNEFCNTNEKSTIDLRKRYNENEAALYCRKYDPQFACQDECKLNPDELSPLNITDGYL